MAAAIWVLAGLGVGIVGVFLLSVEAIKVENISYLRNRFMPSFRRFFESPEMLIPLQYQTNPREMTEEELAEFHQENRLRGFAGHWILFRLFHCIVPVVLLYALDLMRRWLGIGSNRNAIVSLWDWSHIWCWPIFILLILLVLYLSFAFVGCALHKLAEKSIDGVVNLLERIEKGAPTGTVGILGFIPAFMGFVLQTIGVIVDI